MEYEIEIKLLTSVHAGERIKKDLLPQLDIDVKPRLVELTNEYFDTPDRELRKNDIGLRIRSNSLAIEQTLKTAGQSIGGLHQRPEFNVQLPAENFRGSVPDLSLFPISAWPDGMDTKKVQEKLTVLFKTNFSREEYLLTLPEGTQVELVCDLGEIIASGQRLPISEIELELKSGKTSQLFNLARKIVQHIPCSLGKDSKAARGYQLADGNAAAVPSLPAFNSSGNELSDESSFAIFVESALAYFQYHSTEFNCDPNRGAAKEISQVVCRLYAAFENIMVLRSGHDFTSIRHSLQSFMEQWQAMLPGEELSLLTESQINDMKGILAQPDTLRMQLDILECLVEKAQ